MNGPVGIADALPSPLWEGGLRPNWGNGDAVLVAIHPETSPPPTAHFIATPPQREARNADGQD